MSTQKDISKREFQKDTGLVAGGALPLGGRSSGIAYACPYCTTETLFDTAVALKDHIYTQHLWNNSSGHARIPIPMCMSIGGMETQGQVLKRIDEMVKSGFVCDLELDEGVLSDACTRELADAGFEMELNWQGIEELEDNYEVQLNFISDKKRALEDIIGRPVLGGRRHVSHRDKYTYDICDALGFKWYHIRSLITSFPYQVTAPYKPPGHNFALCPRPALHLWNIAGDVIPYQDSIDGGDYFWDNLTKLSASQYEQAFRDATDLRIREGKHHEVRWFCWMENPQRRTNGGPEWFEGMKNSLKFIKERQNAGLIKTMLFSDLVKLFCPDIF